MSDWLDDLDERQTEYWGARMTSPTDDGVQYIWGSADMVKTALVTARLDCQRMINELRYLRKESEK